MITKGYINMCITALAKSGFMVSRMCLYAYMIRPPPRHAPMQFSKILTMRCWKQMTEAIVECQLVDKWAEIEKGATAEFARKSKNFKDQKLQHQKHRQRLQWKFSLFLTLSSTSALCMS